MNLIKTTSLRGWVVFFRPMVLGLLARDRAGAGLNGSFEQLSQIPKIFRKVNSAGLDQIF